MFFILAIVLGFTWFVVFMERGQRRITVNYARRQGSRGAYMNQSSFLPLKLNMAGVIRRSSRRRSSCSRPRSTWFGQNSGATAWLQKVSQMLSPGEPLHMILLAALIIGFAFFYTALVFTRRKPPTT